MPKALRDELAGFHVNRSAFDSGSADVDSKKCQSDFLLYGSLQIRTSGASARNIRYAETSRDARARDWY